MLSRFSNWWARFSGSPKRTGNSKPSSAGLCPPYRASPSPDQEALERLRQAPDLRKALQLHLVLRRDQEVADLLKRDSEVTRARINIYQELHDFIAKREDVIE